MCWTKDNKWRKNKWVTALKYLVLFSATFHMFLLFLYAILFQYWSRLNYFKILELNLFFPIFADNFWSYVFSPFLAILLYFLIYFIVTKYKIN